MQKSANTKHKKRERKKLAENEKNLLLSLTIINDPPNRNIIIKSALLPRNEPSSSIRQYRYVNVILNRKLNPIVPKNKKVVTNRHT